MNAIRGIAVAHAMTREERAFDRAIFLGVDGGLLISDELRYFPIPGKTIFVRLRVDQFAILCYVENAAASSL